MLHFSSIAVVVVLGDFCACSCVGWERRRRFDDNCLGGGMNGECGVEKGGDEGEKANYWKRCTFHDYGWLDWDTREGKTSSHLIFNNT